MAKKKKEKKVNPAKQKIIDNYKQQRGNYLEQGCEEKQEIISVVKANVMAFVTAGPFVILGIIIWILTKKEGRGVISIQNYFLFLVLLIASVFIHELLHGAGWFSWTKGKWKSIYLGVMWEYVTPYCHCKEPLKPKEYLFGVLTPFLILGIGGYIVAWVTESYLLLLLSLFNILAAGGDTTIACMELKYLNRDDCYILDHPTDCGFVAFIKR